MRFFHAGEASVQAAEWECKSRVVDAKALQDRRM
jgi:hypothetical protein